MTPLLSRASDIACPTCHGDGVVTVNPAYPDIRGEIEVRCDTCHGLGTIRSDGEQLHGPWVWAENPYDRLSDECAEYRLKHGEHMPGCPHARAELAPRRPHSHLAAASNPTAQGDPKASLLHGLGAPADSSTDREAA